MIGRLMHFVSWLFYVAFLFGFFTACGGCAGQKKPTLEQALRATVIAADLTYELAVELCDRREKEIIARSPTTLERDKEDLAHVRETCDRIFKVFDETRRLKLLVSELEVL